MQHGRKVNGWGEEGTAREIWKIGNLEIAG